MLPCCDGEIKLYIKLFYAGYQAMPISEARSDTAAKSAVSLPITDIKLPAQEFTPCISKFSFKDGRIRDCCEGNKLYSIYPTVDNVEHSKNTSH